MSGYTARDFEHLCYIRCNNCGTVLAMSVPCKRLFNMVTVKCGHCNGLLCVNLKALQHEPPLPLISVQAPTSTSNGIPPLNRNVSSCENGSCDISSSHDGKNKKSTSTTYREKRHRASSIYNRFIKEEIQRIKATNRKMSHRQAFSRAAKNWALFPDMHSGLALDGKKRILF